MDTRQRVIAGRYALLAPLGSGAMGTVWRAQDEVLGREVAVKEVTFPPWAVRFGAAGAAGADPT